MSNPLSNGQLLADKEIDLLLSIVSNPKATLADSYKDFGVNFTSFEIQACSALSMFIEAGMLNNIQKFSSLFIIQKFSSTRKLESFFTVFDMVLQSSDNNNEKKFVLDLMLGGNVEDYGSMCAANIEDMHEPTDDLFELPQTYHSKKNEVKIANRQVVCDIGVPRYKLFFVIFLGSLRARLMLVWRLVSKI